MVKKKSLLDCSLTKKESLKLKPEAIDALMKVRKNPNRNALGLNDKVLVKIKASKLDEGSYALILKDLDLLATKLKAKSSIKFDNFNSLVGKLSDKNPQNSQAAHWVIKDITENSDDFVGKTWKFEGSVKNSDGNFSFIDMLSNETPPKIIEYKWLTSATVGKNDFIREFIKRDLFNLTDLSKLQWRIKGKKLTKEKVLEYLSSKEAIDVMNSFPKNKKELLFKNFDDLDGVTVGDINVFIDSYFDKIFK